MQDPHRGNIEGSKTVSHHVEHRINWGHVALAVAVIYLVWKAGQVLGAAGQDAEGDGAGVSIEFGADADQEAEVAL